MNPELVSLAIALLGLIAGTVTLAVCMARSILSGVVVSFLALAGSCYCLAVVAYPLLAR